MLCAVIKKSINAPPPFFITERLMGFGAFRFHSISLSLLSRNYILKNYFDNALEDIQCLPSTNKMKSTLENHILNYM